MVRLTAAERRDAIVDAALDVMRRKGIAGTTVRDVADTMGTSSGLVHHYFDSMDELLAAAFDRAADEGLRAAVAGVAGRVGAVARLQAFFAIYTRVERDWAYQLWLDAWAEAARRPAVRETSRRLNVAWQRLLRGAIVAGVREGALGCADPDGAAWRILSLLDGLALQTVAHPGIVDRRSVLAWSMAHAERELTLAPGTLG